MLRRPSSRVPAAAASAAVAVAVAAAGVIVAPGAAASTAAPAVQDVSGRAPLVGTDRDAAIPGHYIVVLETRTSPGAAAEAAGQAVRAGGEVTHRYGSALQGFAARLPLRAVEALRNNPHIAYIEADQRVTASVTQDNATWGLDRVDQRLLPLSSTYSHDRTATGVTAYVIDSGIRSGHRQFGSRVARGFTAVADGRGTGDCNGHGTHVAGTLGAKRYGVAKRVTLRPVRVLNCEGSGSNSKVVAGIDWVSSHHTGNDPAVANVSLGGPNSVAVDTAVTHGIADGVTFVVAAGNESSDACLSSPASVPGALTVAATTRSDVRSGFSNFGTCVDLFAPGSGITSAWHTGNRATATLSGTSMASPHVAGAAALYLQAHPTASPGSVGSALLSAATPGRVTDEGVGSPDLLLFSRVGTAP